MTLFFFQRRTAQWALLIVITVSSVAIGVLSVYALRAAPALFFDSELVTQRAGTEITRIGSLRLEDTDLWKLPVFSSVADEREWWQAQEKLYHELQGKNSVMIEFRDATQTTWQIIADVGRVPAGTIVTRLGLIYLVVGIYIFAAVSVFRHHATTTGFLSAFFLSSTALYLISVAPAVHRPIVLDPELLRFLVAVFFVASTGQISIVHFAMVFPKKKQLLQTRPALAAIFYVYAALISALYLSGVIALTTTLPFLVFWILLMLGSFVHSIVTLDDEFMKKQVRITFLAPLLLATFFLVSVVLPWPEGGSVLNNYALFSLMMPFALILSLDNQRLYRDRLAVEFNSRSEKERIHRELHDTVLNDLASISIAAEGAARADRDPDKIRSRFEQIKNYAAESSRQLRNFLWVIDDRQNTWDDVSNSLRRLGYDLLSHLEVAFELEASATGKEVAPPTPAMKHTIHQIFREALINVTKHAQATEVRSSLTFGKSCAVIVVTDNGVGISRETGRTGGYGLNNMRRRIKEHDGELVIESTPGLGTKIVAQIPIR